jgi:hypothetical protein
MIIFIQYTLADVRSLAGLNKVLLKSPSWPTPTPFKEFVRYSGQIIPRSKGGLNSWVGEDFVCKIRRGIHLQNIRLNRFPFELRNVSKQQYTNGILNKYEFVFVSRKSNLTAFNRNFMEDLKKSIDNTDISIRTQANCIVETKLHKIDSHIKSLYLLSSTKNKEVDIERDKNLVNFCIPQVYIHFEPHEKLTISENNLITKKGGIPLNFNFYGFWNHNQNKPVKIWICDQLELSHLTRADNRNRKLRISMLRFFSEYECLKSVMSAIQNGRINAPRGSSESDLLQGYLNKITKTILSDVSLIQHYTDSDETLLPVQKMFKEALPGGLEDLKNKIIELNLRPNIEKKTIELIMSKNEYNISKSQIGAVGDGAKAENNTFQQMNYSLPENFDYSALSDELKRLKPILTEKAQTPEQKASVELVVVAEDEVSKKNGNAVVKSLIGAGKWVLGVAEDIGAKITAEIISKHMGI